ncbi:MAG: hypothetical protein JNL28_07135 [Planctomycetes bacterium]|nr:hypothetical protein [Planctomycetota bacterium]
MHSPPPTNRTFWITRVVFAVIAVVLSPYCYWLTTNPANTAENFAWTLAPRFSALMFASLYLAGVYGFLRIAFGREWHRVALLVSAILAVLAGLGVVSLLHWEKFTSDPLRIGIWSTAYLIFPPILLVLIVLNRKQDPRTPAADDVVVPASLRRFTLILGLVFGAVGAALILAPATMSEIWPWAMKPLAAQSIGVLLVAPAVAQVIALRESRWSALKLVTETGLIWFTAILVSVVRCLAEFDRTRPATWLFFAFLIVEWGMILWMYLSFEKARRSRRAAGTPPADHQPVAL